VDRNQSVDEANDHCLKNRDVGVIAVAGGFIFVARLYAGEPQTEPEGVIATKSKTQHVFYSDSPGATVRRVSLTHW